MNPDVVKQVVTEHQQGSVNREQELWTLLVFETWYRKFADRTGRPAERTADFATAGAR
jgi:hypothetical protein